MNVMHKRREINTLGTAASTYGAIFVPVRTSVKTVANDTTSSYGATGKVYCAVSEGTFVALTT